MLPSHERCDSGTQARLLLRGAPSKVGENRLPGKDSPKILAYAGFAQKFRSAHKVRLIGDLVCKLTVCSQSLFNQ